MVVNGDIRSDARVRKCAQSVQKLGYDVTLLYGARGATKKALGTLGAVTTIALPLPNHVSVAKAKRERERLARRRGFPGFRSAAELEWARHQKVLAGLRASRHSLPLRSEDATFRMSSVRWFVGPRAWARAPHHIAVTLYVRSCLVGE
jgi:hypothetical protein